jgi:O-antigen ligase
MTVIRVGVCALLAFAILAFGATDTIILTILEIGTAALFLWWALLVALGPTSELLWAPALWPLAGLEALAVLQLLGHFTMYPYLTKLELLRLTSYLLLAFLSVQAFRAARHWRQFAWFAIWLGFFIAIFGIIQSLTFNGKLYWVRTLEHGGIPFGPFVNRNHFAGAMELLIPMALAMLAVRGVRRQQLPLVMLCAAVSIGALVLSASRAGIVALGVELVLMVVLLEFSGGEQRHLVTGIVVIALAVSLVAWLGFGPVITRFQTVQSQEVSVARRISLAHGAWHIFLDHPALGTGLGTTISVYPRYETAYDGFVIDHLHDDHLELLAETGVAGGLCWLAFLGCLAWYGYRGLARSTEPSMKAAHLGALVGCAGLLFHGFFDFNLHIPSNAALFFVMAALATTPAAREPARLPLRAQQPPQ